MKAKKNDALQNLNNELEKKNQSLKTELDILKLSTLKLTKENQSLKKEDYPKLDEVLTYSKIT